MVEHQDIVRRAWKGCMKLLYGGKQQQTATQQELPISNSASSSSSLSCKDLILVSGAAGLGVALVVYGLPLGLRKWHLQCPSCGCNCCACAVSHQRPSEWLKKLSDIIFLALETGKEKLRTSLHVSTVPASSDNGSWTCINVGDGNVTTTVTADGGSSSEGALTDSQSRPDPHCTGKRSGYLTWDDYFMSIAFLSSQRSKDPNRQVGACLVSQDHIILGIGYNGFPRGCSDDKLPWSKVSKDGDILKTKYPYVCHAEMNAILNKNLASASGQRIYVTMFPCNECAKILIQAGIAEIVYYTDKQTHTAVSYAASRKLLAMANVKVRQHQPKTKSIVLNFQQEQ